MTGRVINNLIEIRQGDSFPINLELRDAETDKPKNLTGASLQMQVRDKDGNIKFSLYGSEVDAKKGKIALLLTPIQTNIPVGDYVTDIQLLTSDGSVNTIFPADVNQVAIFRITPQVTTGV